MTFSKTKKSIIFLTATRKREWVPNPKTTNSLNPFLLPKWPLSINLNRRGAVSAPATKSMKKYFEPIIIIFLTVLIISLSFYPTIDKFLNAPKNTVYIGTHNYVLDYSTYLYKITLGQKGQFFTKELHTTESQPGSLSHIYFVLAGLLTSPFNIPPYIVYHLLRLISALIFAASVYWFVSLFAKNSFQRIALFFLSYVSAGFPRILKALDGSFSLHLYLSEWSGFDVIRRSAFLPHSLMQNSLTLLTIGLFIKYEKNPQRKYLILAGTLLFITNLFSPFHSTLVLLSYFIYSLYKLKLKRLLLLLTFYLPSLIYVQHSFNFGVLALAKKWEAETVRPIDFTNYSLGLGPIFFLGIIGIILSLKSKGYKNFSLIFITLTTFALLFILPLDKILGINNFRLLGIPLHVFLGILSFYALSRFKKVLIIILIIFFLPTIPTYYLSISQLKNEYAEGGYPYNIFLPVNYYQGINWIKENTDYKKDIILSRLLTGNLIPGLTGNRVYLGHPIGTLQFAQKIETANQFFENKMSTDQAKKFLSENSISYIYYSYDEYLPPDLTKYPFLIKVYTNLDVNIYQFSP